MCVSTLSLSLFYNELISVQLPNRLLLPCCHSVALNHPKVYKKMCVSWETWILPQLSLSLFFLPLSVFFVSQHFDLLTPSFPHLLLLTLFPSTTLSFPSPFPFQPPLLCTTSSLLPRCPSCNDCAQYQGKSVQGVCSLLSFIFLSQSFGFFFNTPQ